MGARAKDTDPAADKRHYVMLPGTRMLNSIVGPNFSNRGFTITADVTRSGAVLDGVILAYGRRACGFSFFVKDAKPAFDFNLAGSHTVIMTDVQIPPGSSRLALRIAVVNGVATARLSIDDSVVADRELPQLFPTGLGGLSIQCGHNSPSAVSSEYQPPFTFSGMLDRVVIDLDPRPTDATESQLTAELAQQ